MQVPLAQVVGPFQPFLPHCLYKAAEVDSTGGVPPRADWMALSNTGYTREAIIASPVVFGWIPSLQSDVGYPEAQSTIVMGELVAFRPLTHAGIARRQS